MFRRWLAYSRIVFVPIGFLVAGVLSGCAVSSKKLIADCRDGSSGAACFKLAQCYERGRCGLRADPERAKYSYKKGCEQYFEPACKRVDEGDTSTDSNSQLSSREEDCKSGSALPCMLLAGELKATEPSHSRIHYLDACKLGIAEGCAAAHLLAKALCLAVHSGAGCTAYGLDLLKGELVPQNRGLGILSIKQGCELGDKQGCALLVRIQENIQ